MLTKSRVFAALTLLVCSACSNPVVDTSKSMDHEISSSNQGSVRIHGDFWQVADVIAIQEAGITKIVFTDQPFDRRAFAIDGKLDSFDILKHHGHTLTLNIDSDGPSMCVDYTGSQGGGSKCRSDYPKAIRLTAHTEARVIGNMQWGDKNTEHIRVNFDLPVESKIARAGDPLPADGGEPGKALLAHFSAIAGGNFEEFKACVHPRRLYSMSAPNPAEAQEMLKMLQEMSPSKVKVTGGVVQGETALVDFTGENRGEKMKGVAQLSRYHGRWYVDSTTESAGTSK